MSIRNPKFSRHTNGEAAAHAAVAAHAAALVPGTRVVSTRGVTGTILGEGPGLEVRLEGDDGLRWSIDLRDLEASP
jgi:hypothetical protein